MNFHLLLCLQPVLALSSLSLGTFHIYQARSHTSSKLASPFLNFNIDFFFFTLWVSLVQIVGVLGGFVCLFVFSSISDRY